MNRFKKYGSILLSCLCLALPLANVSESTLITAEAHSGRTDARGGHHDYKNKSGLGSYHYHCGGYPAHLHTNGVCPYTSGSATSVSGTAAAETAAVPATAPAASVSEEQLNAYQAVFDAAYYYAANADLQSAIGNDSLRLFTHFYNSGMAEGRRGSENFDVAIYRENNPDLTEVFGDDLKLYYDHFIQSGQNEGRIHN